MRKGARLATLLLALIAVTLQQTSFSVSTNSSIINAFANYTWTISFSNSTPRGNITLNFPSTCSFANIGTVTVNTFAPNNYSINANAIFIDSSQLFSTAIIIVRNVKNPYAAFTYTSQFYMSSTADGNIINPGFIKYIEGTLLFNSWSFSLCTQQPNSVLTIKVTTANLIPAGNSKFQVGYGAWLQHNSKHLLTDVGSLTASVSINGGTSSGVINITFSTTNQKIIITYNLPGILNASSTLQFNITGVQSPPTATTPTNSNYRVATTDISGSIIDQASSCTILPTCVLNITTGIFNSINMPVNSNYTPQPVVITFVETPIITFQNGDTIEMHFSSLSNFNGCNILEFYRNIGNNPTTNSLTLNSTFIQYTLFTGSSALPNTDYNFSITIKVFCSSVKITSSQTPVALTFKFKRNTYQYLQLSATMRPNATIVSAANATLSLSTNEMTKTPVSYTLSVVTAQPLGLSPSLKFYFTNDIVITAPTCSVTLSVGSASGANCTLNATSNVISLNFSCTGIIAASTNISVVIAGFTNPASPVTRSIGVQTYYDSTSNTSLVEYNTAAFSVTFAGITNYPTTFSPSNLTVYTSTPTSISFSNSILIPNGSNIYVQFPAATSSVTPDSSPLTINNQVNSATVVNHGNNSFTITTTADISATSSISITSSIVSTSTMGNFTYIVLRIEKNTTLYLQSAYSMFLNVNKTVSLQVTIAPLNPKTGAVSGYTVTITLSVPHPSSFYVQVDLPSDVSYNSTAASCLGNCNSTIRAASNFTSFIIQAQNPSNSTLNQVLTFNLSAAFTNPRSKGTSLPWTFTTKSISTMNTITVSSRSPQISSTNTLTANMLPDSYYKNNSNMVKISFNFTNTLIAGDYIQMLISTITYTQSTTINCSPIYADCTKSNASTAGTLIINIIPNLTANSGNSLTINLEGLISGSSIIDSIPVKSFTSANRLIDQGTMQYQLSCKDGSSVTILNNCRTCYSDKSCIDCYTNLGFYLAGGACVTSCGDATSFRSYDNSASGVCTACVNNCFTCSSSTSCLSCVPGSGYFYLQSNSSCKATCSASGYVQSQVSGVRYCDVCYGGASCLQCSSNAPGACTLCVSSSVLSNGLCSSNCSNNSMYASGGICLNCDASCSSCQSGGNGGCTKCALNYYNYNEFCLAACPTDTAPNANGYCSCDSPCSKCQISTTNCTACLNASLFVSLGSCVTSCPANSYLAGSTCVPCSTACVSCTATTCVSCLTSYYLYNNVCYSDCNQIGQQYDASGTTCVMCPDGCDSCSRATCYSCLPNYSLSSGTSQCVKTCLLTNSCEISGEQVVPLPGLISVFVWTAIVVIIKLVMHKAYVPYSLIMGSSVIQFVLIIATIANAADLAGYSFRLLAASSAERLAVRGLLGGTLAINYISNVVYVVLFVKYIKPLVTNPRQIDVIANVVVLVFGTLTNYRFAVMAFSKMFPKPAIHVQNASKLTPIHYLAISSLVLDLLPLAACIMALMNEQPLTNLFMLAIDLLVVILINVFITIWFVSCKKPEEYFESEVKKYHAEDHNNTHESIDLPLDHEKNMSKAKMEGYHCEDQDLASNKLEDNSSSYKKMSSRVGKNSVKTVRQTDSFIRKVSPSHISKEEQKSDESDLNVDIASVSVKREKVHSKQEPQQDVNFEEGLKSKHGAKSAAKMATSERANFRQTLKSEGKSVEEGLSARKKSQADNFSKQMVSSASARKNYQRPERDIQEAQDQGDIGDLPEQSNNESVFETQKERIPKPQRVGEKRPNQKKPQRTKAERAKAERTKAERTKAERTNELQEPLKIMKKDNKIGYFDTDAFESNAEEDIETIIKQKVWQSAVKHEKQTDNEPPQNSNSETEYEEISPSRFNVQNQRVDLSDFGDNQSEP